MTKRIWLIGGTQESAQLAQAIAPLNLPCLISVTTESAIALYPTSPSIQIWVGKLSPDQLPKFLQEHQVAVVLDASHPFAVEISQSAIAATTALQIPYLRFERQELATVQQLPNSTISVANFETLLATNLLQQQRVLLTIGYRSLPLFKSWQEKSTLFARILPSPTALEAALEAGFTNDRLIALRPPVNFELERSLWQHWQISMVVTKASGSPGGEDVKREVAAELGVKLIVVDRPTITYPQQTNDVMQAVNCCRHYLS